MVRAVEIVIWANPFMPLPMELSCLLTIVEVAGALVFYCAMFYRDPQTKKVKYIDSQYAHLRSIAVKNGDFVKRGQQIGTLRE